MKRHSTTRLASGQLEFRSIISFKNKSDSEPTLSMRSDEIGTRNSAKLYKGAPVPIKWSKSVESCQ